MGIVRNRRRGRRSKPALTPHQRSRILRRIERQRIHPVLRKQYPGPRRRGYRFPRPHVERYQIRHRVEGIIFELVLDPLVDGVRLEDDLLDDEVKGLELRAAREDVVPRLGGAVAHQEAALLADDVLGAGSGDGAVVPRVGAEVATVQREFPFEGFF